jgi:hypothetical protein
MESRQISSADISKHLANIKSLDRYDREFRAFWAYAVERGEDPYKMSLAKVAAMLQNFNDLSSAEARHAYAALLLVPTYEQLRFSPFLKSCKRLWNQTTVRYTEFWDAGAVLKKLAGQPVNWHSIEEVRDRLIVVCRLLHLHRSIDLCRTLRTVSLQGDKMFILVRRKGMLAAQWEEVMKMDGGGGGHQPPSFNEALRASDQVAG